MWLCVYSCYSYLMGYALCRRPLTIARCSKIADSWHLQKEHRFVVHQIVIWHAWCLYSGVLRDPGSILGHWGAQERTLRGPGLDFYWFVTDLETSFWQFLMNFEQTRCILSRCFQGSFSQGFWDWIWTSRIGKQGVAMAKTTFTEIGLLMISELVSMFLVA